MIDIIYEDDLSGIDAPNYWRDELREKINEIITELNELTEKMK